MRQRPPFRHRTVWCRLLAPLALALVAGTAAPAQDPAPPPLLLDGLVPGGVRSSATESWGKFDFSLTNTADFDRRARVLLNYQGQPDVQYGRDVWVPARSTVSTWVLVGPAPPQKTEIAREIEYVLYERVGDKDVVVFPPAKTCACARGRSCTGRGAGPKRPRPSSPTPTRRRSRPRTTGTSPGCRGPRPGPTRPSSSPACSAAPWTSRTKSSS